MELGKIIFVLLAFSRVLCVPEGITETNRIDGFSYLEDVVIEILTTCYADQDNTVVLIGDSTRDFTKRLSTYQSFSLVLLDDFRRVKNSTDDSKLIDSNRKHKVALVVMIISDSSRFEEMLNTYTWSVYDNPMASLLILDDYSVDPNSCFEKQNERDVILFTSFLHNMLNTNLLCYDATYGIVIMYTINPYTNQAPEPWIKIRSMRKMNSDDGMYFYLRVHEKGRVLCENLVFDKTQDLSGATIEISMIQYEDTNRLYDETKLKFTSEKRLRVDKRKNVNFIERFIEYVNASREVVFKDAVLGQRFAHDGTSILTVPVSLRGVKGQLTSHTYPHGVFCGNLVTQFRGNKSQLQKIASVIDRYSWIGMYVVYAITLIFFKFFLRQPLIVGLLNLSRLTGNVGLPTSPRDGSSRIYVACLLFFVVTMQGIFIGNLAALLTHDIPVRQVDSIQDLVDLNYTVYAEEVDFAVFDDPFFANHLTLLPNHFDCFQHVRRVPSVACVTRESSDLLYAEQNNLYVGTDCILNDYFFTLLPNRWALEERINKYLGILTSAHIKISLEMLVNEKRLLEADAEETSLEPNVLKLNDLGFAFAILGIGLWCAFITFIVEILIYKFL